MIISNNQIQQVAKAYGDQTKLSKSTKSGRTAATQRPDEVILSASAQEFGGLIRKLQALPDVRADVVGVLSDQITQGSYHVAAYEIAGKMVSGS
jgi:negative regulator of flagellin synthesis FlgM